MSSLITSLNDLAKLAPVIGQEGVEVLRRSLGDMYAELDDQVKREDFHELRDVVLDLAEAQKRTEQRVEELAEAQKRTEQRVEELAEAQRKTERELAALTKVVGRIQVELGGLARNAGFLLEDRAYIALPFLLKQRHGVEVLGPLNRGFLPGTKERSLEVNIWGPARQPDGTQIQILGEAKTQLSEKHIREFERHTALVQRAAPGHGPYLYLLVTSQAEPEVAEAVKKRGWLLFYSYEPRNGSWRG